MAMGWTCGANPFWPFFWRPELRFLTHQPVPFRPAKKRVERKAWRANLPTHFLLKK